MQKLTSAEGHYNHSLEVAKRPKQLLLVFYESTLMKRPIILLVLATTLIASMSSAHAQRRGQKASNFNGEMLSQSCFACHGDKGSSVAPYIPTIGGQNEEYLNDALKGYRDKKRPGTIMKGLMQGYSDGEIAAISAFVAKQPWKGTAQQFDVALVSKGRDLWKRACSTCHLNGGRESKEPAYPLLAGQWLGYLKISIEDVKTDLRKVDDRLLAKLDE